MKRYKPGRSASTRGSFPEVVTQLCEAFENSVPCRDGQRYVPSKVFFITPYAIDARTLETRFAKISGPGYRGLKIIDGSKLESLVRKNLPSLVIELCGEEYDISQAVATLLNNKALLRALNFHVERPIESFYVDIDLSVGKLASRLLLLGRLHPVSSGVQLAPDGWISLKNLASKAKRVLAWIIHEI